MLTFLIMAGGSGERFWPLSTKCHPKQILKIFNKKSLLRLTYERILPLVDKDNIFIATNEIQLEIIKKELPELNCSRFIVEPEFRDTASAISYGSMIISKYFHNPTICVLASDALIFDEEEFRATIKVASSEAEKNKIVTLGVTPTYAETGYGYIEITHNIVKQPESIVRFCEKPDQITASKYLKSGKYLWNCGIFVFKYETLLDVLKLYSRNHFDITKKLSEQIEDNNNEIITCSKSKDLFHLYTKTSFDYAIMEKADNVSVIPSIFRWDDVGHYLAFEKLLKSDLNNNIKQNVDCITLDSYNNIIVSDCDVQKISLLGISNMIISLNKNDILICSKEKYQDIKEIVNIRHGIEYKL